MLLEVISEWDTIISILFQMIYVTSYDDSLIYSNYLFFFMGDQLQLHAQLLAKDNHLFISINYIIH